MTTRHATEIIDDVTRVADVYTERHFVYTSGQHGHGYVNYRALKEPTHTDLRQEVATLLLARTIADAGYPAEEPILVVGPETLGQLLVHDLAQAQQRGEVAQTLIFRSFAKDASGEGFVWNEALPSDLPSATPVVWLDDLLNRTSTFTKTRMLLVEAGLSTIAIGVIGDRSQASTADLRVVCITALQHFTLDAYPPADCPYCTEERPIVRKPGHGYKFEVIYPAYPGGFVDTP